MNKKAVILLCIVISSCSSAPTSVDSDTSYQSNIPEFDYDKEQKDYMNAHRYEIDKKNINETLNNTENLIITYLNSVGQINECSKYLFYTPYSESPRQLIKSININDAKIVVERIAKQARTYAQSVNENFNWNWNNGADIQTGKNFIDKGMRNVYLDAGVNSSVCFNAVNSLNEPSFQIIYSNYNIVFTKGSRSLLATKAAMIIHRECKKDLEGFNFFPNGYERLASKTFHTISIESIAQNHKRKRSGMYKNDMKRYLDAHGGSPFERLFKISPCDDFKKEYYEILRNSWVKFQQQ